jgi:hypothetical protein
MALIVSGHPKGGIVKIVAKMVPVLLFADLYVLHFLKLLYFIFLFSLSLQKGCLYSLLEHSQLEVTLGSIASYYMRVKQTNQNLIENHLI